MTNKEIKWVLSIISFLLLLLTTPVLAAETQTVVITSTNDHYVIEGPSTIEQLSKLEPGIKYSATNFLLKNKLKTDIEVTIGFDFKGNSQSKSELDVFFNNKIVRQGENKIFILKPQEVYKIEVDFKIKASSAKNSSQNTKEMIDWRIQAGDIKTIESEKLPQTNEKTSYFYIYLYFLVVVLILSKIYYLYSNYN